MAFFFFAIPRPFHAFIVALATSISISVPISISLSAPISTSIISSPPRDILPILPVPHRTPSPPLVIPSLSPPLITPRPSSTSSSLITSPPSSSRSPLISSLPLLHLLDNLVHSRVHKGEHKIVHRTLRVRLGALGPRHQLLLLFLGIALIPQILTLLHAKKVLRRITVSIHSFGRILNHFRNLKHQTNLLPHVLRKLLRVSTLPNGFIVIQRVVVAGQSPKTKKGSSNPLNLEASPQFDAIYQLDKSNAYHYSSSSSSHC